MVDLRDRELIGEYFIPEIGRIYAIKATNERDKNIRGNFYAVNEKSLLVNNCESEKELNEKIVDYISSKAQSLTKISEKVSKNGLEQYLIQTLQNKTEGGNK